MRGRKFVNPPQTLVGDPGPRQTSIGKNSDCVMKSEQGVLVRGSDPPQGHRVHTKAGDMWRAPARRLREKPLAAGVYLVGNRRQKVSIPLQWQKSDIFSGLDKERSTSRATKMVLADTKRVDRGLILHRVCRRLVCRTDDKKSRSLSSRRKNSLFRFRQ